MSLDELITNLQKARAELGEDSQVYVQQHTGVPTIAGLRHLSEIQSVKVKPAEESGGFRFTTPRVTLFLKA